MSTSWNAGANTISLSTALTTEEDFMETPDYKADRIRLEKMLDARMSGAEIIDAPPNKAARGALGVQTLLRQEREKGGSL